MFDGALSLLCGQRLSIVERLDEYQLTCVGDRLEPSSILEQCLQLLSCAEQISPRDQFELTVEFAGDPVTVSSTSKKERKELINHLNEHSESGYALCDLKVRKRLVDSLSIYSLTAFGEYLRSEELAKALLALGGRFEDRLVFECFSPIEECGSETIKFLPKGGRPKRLGTEDFSRPDALSVFRDNSYNLGIETTFLPSDFYLKKRTGIPDIDRFMDRACAVLCAIYLVSSSQLGQKTLTYKLVGYKSIEDEVEFSRLEPALAGLYKIYEWAYGVRGSADRLGLARNVVSLHVDRLQDVTDQSALWNAIYSNYQIYLKENVASYLEIKNKISEFLVEATAKAHGLVDELIDSLKNSLFVLMTFFLTVVVVNGLKDAGAKVVFSEEYLFIVIILCVVLSVWVISACFAAVSRLDKSAEMTENILKKAYGRIILPEEIDESVAPIYRENREYLVRQCWRYGLCWVAIASILILMFIGGHCAFVG